MPRYLYNGSRYPVILGGSGYVTTRPAAKCLFSESMKLPFFHLEDVFLTGFAAENCAIPRYGFFKLRPSLLGELPEVVVVITTPFLKKLQ